MQTQCSVTTQYSTTFIVNHLYGQPRASKLLTTTYPKEYGYEWTCSSQVLQQREKVVVLHCILLVCTWMDDEFIVSMDAVVRGKLVVHHTALMQNSCRPESNLRQR